jgi:aryl-alcohol dehydrogenase-like predicted oxidoreductase
MSWLKDKLLGPGSEEKFEKIKKLKTVSNELGISMPIMAIAWCLKNPNVSTVILGASRNEQLVENLKAAEAVSLLTDDVVEKLEAILQNKPVDIDW